MCLFTVAKVVFIEVKLVQEAVKQTNKNDQGVFSFVGIVLFHRFGFLLSCYKGHTQICYPERSLSVGQGNDCPPT